MSNEHHILELLPAYTLGALEAAEAEQVALHLSRCAACQAEWRAYQAVTDDLPLAVEQVEPPARLRQQLMARIQVVEKPLRASFWQQLTAVFRQHKAIAFSQLALLSLVALLLVSNILLWQQVNRVESQPASGQLQAIRLNNTGFIPNADGYLVISADGLSGAIILDQLPSLEAQEYQLWLVKDGERTSGALLAVDELGYGGGRINAPEQLFNYTWAEVTIETAGGSPQPTSNVILSAPLLP
jgi:anti-sigma-K factor RskA